MSKTKRRTIIALIGVAVLLAECRMASLTGFADLLHPAQQHVAVP